MTSHFPPNSRPSPETVGEVAQNLERLVSHFENYPHPEVKEGVLEMLSMVDELHRPAIQGLAALLERADPALLDRAKEDPAIHMLLVLYEVIPHPLIEPESPPDPLITTDELLDELN